DASGNIVRYVFRYKQPGCSMCDLDDLDVMSNLTDLEVTGTYIPAAVAQMEKEAVEQFEKGHPRPK
ncbi:MAG TPA: hypothetical protein VJ376_08040, partial [Pseudomonadota bacterium]|nr:hypothetical protein [Pseudomonadota bacterium]